MYAQSMQNNFGSVCQPAFGIGEQNIRKLKAVPDIYVATLLQIADATLVKITKDALVHLCAISNSQREAENASKRQGHLDIIMNDLTQYFQDPSKARDYYNTLAANTEAIEAYRTTAGVTKR